MFGFSEDSEAEWYKTQFCPPTLTDTIYFRTFSSYYLEALQVELEEATSLQLTHL